MLRALPALFAVGAGPVPLFPHSAMGFTVGGASGLAALRIAAEAGLALLGSGRGAA
ncbi:MAG: hypothetical protein AAF074_16810 [Pseudomonadota bacterium]